MPKAEEGLSSSDLSSDSGSAATERLARNQSGVAARSHLAETACLSFEEEVQARTREIIDESPPTGLAAAQPLALIVCPHTKISFYRFFWARWQQKNLVTSDLTKEF